MVGPKQSDEVTQIHPADLQEYVDWLEHGRLHFRFSDVTKDTPGKAARDFLGFLEYEGPEPAMHRGEASIPARLVGNAVGSPYAPDDPRKPWEPPQPQAARCSIVLALSDPVPLSVAVYINAALPFGGSFEGLLQSFVTTDFRVDSYYDEFPDPEHHWLQLSSPDDSPDWVLQIGKWQQAWFTDVRNAATEAAYNLIRAGGP